MINQLSIPFKKTRADISDIPRVITWKFAVARVGQFDKYIYYVYRIESIFTAKVQALKHCYCDSCL